MLKPLPSLFPLSRERNGLIGSPLPPLLGLSCLVLACQARYFTRRSYRGAVVEVNKMNIGANVHGCGALLVPTTPIVSVGSSASAAQPHNTAADEAWKRPHIQHTHNTHTMGSPTPCSFRGMDCPDWRRRSQCSAPHWRRHQQWDRRCCHAGQGTCS